MASKKAAPLSGDLVATKGAAVSSAAVNGEDRKDMVQTTLRLDSKRYDALKMAAIRLRRPAKDIMIEALDAFLKAKCPDMAKELGI